MNNLFDEIIRQEMEAKGPVAAAAKIQEYLDKEDNIPLNMAITGESGSGKSTFVNALRGVQHWAKAAAPTGVVETTIDVRSYPHPVYPNMKVWDLPGIGTTTFPAEQYLKDVDFQRFDFFIIISSDRFRENDVKLALEIQRMKKKFYFVRSKIDESLQSEKRSRRDFSEEATLRQIREDCIKGLQTLGVESPKVFLISSFELHLYDFETLQQTLDKDIPEHKRDVLLIAMPAISLEIINKKKEVFKSKIKLYAVISACVAAVPIPGTSIVTDLAMLVRNISKYQVGFGLDRDSLQGLADTINVLFDDLKAVTKSLLSGGPITKEVIVKILSMSAVVGALTLLEEGSRFIPLFGIPVALSLSFISTYRAHSYLLNMLADDAQAVFIEALRLKH